MKNMNIKKLMLFALLPSMAFVAQSAAMEQNNSQAKQSALTVVVTGVIEGQQNSPAVEDVRSPSLSTQAYSYSPTSDAGSDLEEVTNQLEKLRVQAVLDGLATKAGNKTGSKRKLSDS